MDVRAVIAVSTADVPVFGCLLDALKPGFHIVVSVVSVVSIVRKKFIGQILLYGNLPYKCSIQKKRQIQLVVRDEFYRSYEFFSYDRYNDMETRLKGCKCGDACRNTRNISLDEEEV